MILLVDIGNTSTKVKFETVTIIDTNPEYKVKDLIELLGEYKILGVTEVEAVVISSVVPQCTETFVKYSREVLGIEPLLVNKETSKYEVNDEVGADIIATTNAVIGEAIIIMLGTATVINYVENGVFRGVVIAPGVYTAVRSLIENTALLEDFVIDTPPSVLGLNTIECLQSGAIYGHAAMIDGIIERINPSEDVKIIAMGGFADKIIPLCKREIEIDNDLLFKGLMRIYEHSL